MYPMNIFNYILPRKRSIGEVLALKKYRILRAEVYKLYEQEKEAAKVELEKAVAVPTVVYNTRIHEAHLDFVRVEEELWKKHMMGTMNE